MLLGSHVKPLINFYLEQLLPEKKKLIIISERYEKKKKKLRYTIYYGLRNECSKNC